MRLLKCDIVHGDVTNRQTATPPLHRQTRQMARIRLWNARRDTLPSHCRQTPVGDLRTMPPIAPRMPNHARPTRAAPGSRTHSAWERPAAAQRALAGTSAPLGKLVPLGWLAVSGRALAQWADSEILQASHRYEPAQAPPGTLARAGVWELPSRASVSSSRPDYPLPAPPGSLSDNPSCNSESCLIIHCLPLPVHSRTTRAAIVNRCRS